MSDTPQPAGAGHADLAPPPDDRNPPIIDARKTFVITMISAALFIGAVIIFVL